MQVDVALILLGLALGQAGLPAGAGGPALPRYLPRERAVEGWRREAALNLDAAPGARVGLLLGRDPPALGRCVRLNNYWCIKRAGWSGEIASDAEGHVAFASAAEGAAVAALLLRRYYVDYGRHSARAIVSRWAPASCGQAPAARRGAGALARRGIGGTLRARWLAAHRGRAGGVGRLRGRASAVPDRLIGAAAPAPAIALGLGAAPASLAASLPEVLASKPASPGPAPAACAGDARRIDNYAARAAAGIAASPDADLGLFDGAGRPTPNLSRMLRNMAAVEVGPYGAAPGLVEAAAARAEAVVAARAAPPPAGPGGAARARLDEAARPEPRP